jgi:anti-sigma B factor antagonist
LITETKTHRVEPDITVFEISGRLNLGNLLQSAENAVLSLIDSGARKLVIDLTGLTAIDSSGIGMLISCAGHMDQMGGQMRLAGAHGAVGRILETVHMDRIVPLDADLALACGSLSSRDDIANRSGK